MSTFEKVLVIVIFCIWEVAVSAGLFFAIRYFVIRKRTGKMRCPKCNSWNLKVLTKEFYDSYYTTVNGTDRVNIYDNNNQVVGHADIPAQKTERTEILKCTFVCRKCKNQFEDFITKS